ncbi:uncharacterized protein LOC128886823 [Hylaeus anthracinus]|uniref:uncharacterized protein LOC128886823 n=1 Tax=Hylaeus anthracinus TaxID=313031 RepID=UPI0023B901F4|nr:uncharacterized protein LOC128886823 [Hylaeus anthracinus]XP_053997975.1 uncharacterized protein LOC128886823 [Hylaeus anthracinus]
MYKTVRKGDASLQYTILPQTDQLTASGFPQGYSKSRPRIIKYTMGTLMVLMILSCVATPFLMNQDDQSLFASTILAMGRVGHNTAFRNASRSQGENVGGNRSRSRLPDTMAMASTEAYRKQDVEVGMTSALGVLKPEEPETENLTATDAVASSTRRFQITTEAPPSLRQTSSSVTLPSTSFSSSTTLKVLASTSTEVPATLANSQKKERMPRVTLKLRENETIPQMYMKAGIASYKKGNITTSVLAHGLSLEGLIFKTPEGTIKPWPQKWFFTDPSSDFQWKGLNQMPVAIYVVLAGLATLASVSMILMFYVQRKSTRRQRQSAEEPEAGGQEEDKSTLLGAESQEIEEKE